MKKTRAANGREHRCCTCCKLLDPHDDAVVYLGWGARDDGRPGPGWVAALCAPEVGRRESPCVVAARDWAERHGVQFIPSDYAAWLGDEDAEHYLDEGGEG